MTDNARIPRRVLLLALLADKRNEYTIEREALRAQAARARSSTTRYAARRALVALAVAAKKDERRILADLQAEARKGES